nr:RNA-directed DNA polymerase, eukaryota, nucleotide-binding alpha-beta plait domain protein [Tanacetum cinerariifolium]
MGKIIDINALSNFYSLLENEGFDKVNHTYLGGFWVLIKTGSSKSKENMCKHVGVASYFSELLPANDSFVSDDRLVCVSVEGLPIKTLTHKSFTEIVSPWGSLSEVEDEDDATLPYKKLCIITKSHICIDSRIKVIIKGCVYWVPVKELDVWALDFNNYLSDNDMDKELPDDEILYHGSGYNDLDCNSGKSKDAKTPSVDPFGIYDILNKKPNNSENKIDDPTFPLGFTPGDMADNHVGTKDDNIEKHMGDIQPNKEGRSGSKSGNNSILYIKPGGSILNVIENLVEIGQTMGYSMDECMKNIESIIGDQGEYWGNSLVGHMIEEWDGECVILGDFNKVRMKQERFGTVLNALGANAFNQFIDLASLVDLPIEGYSFT